MQFLCKFCGRQEEDPQSWCMAFHLTKPGTDLRNTIFLMNGWDEAKALQENTLHFCSRLCQERYLERWREQLAA